MAPDAPGRCRKHRTAYREALALRWADIDLAAATAIISRSGVDAQRPRQPQATALCRWSPDVVAALVLQLETQTALNRQLGLGAPAADALVFTSKKGTPVDPRNSRRDLKRILVRLDLPTERPCTPFGTHSPHDFSIAAYRCRL